MGDQGNYDARNESNEGWEKLGKEEMRGGKKIGSQVSKKGEGKSKKENREEEKRRMEGMTSQRVKRIKAKIKT